MGGQGESVKEQEEEAGENSEDPEDPEGLSVLNGSSSRIPKPEVVVLVKEEVDEAEEDEPDNGPTPSGFFNI